MNAAESSGPVPVPPRPSVSAAEAARRLQQAHAASGGDAVTSDEDATEGGAAGPRTSSKGSRTPRATKGSRPSSARGATARGGTKAPNTKSVGGAGATSGGAKTTGAGAQKTGAAAKTTGAAAKTTGAAAKATGASGKTGGATGAAGKATGAAAKKAGAAGKAAGGKRTTAGAARTPKKRTPATSTTQPTPAVVSDAAGEQDELKIPPKPPAPVPMPPPLPPRPEDAPVAAEPDTVTSDASDEEGSSKAGTQISGTTRETTATGTPERSEAVTSQSADSLTGTASESGDHVADAEAAPVGTDDGQVVAVTASEPDASPLPSATGGTEVATGDDAEPEASVDDETAASVDEQSAAALVADEQAGASVEAQPEASGDDESKVSVDDESAASAHAQPAAAPVADEQPEAPVADTQPEAPVAEEQSEAPVAEEQPEAPVADEQAEASVDDAQAEASVVDIGDEAAADSAQPALAVRGLVKSFSGTAAVGGIDLTVPAGTFYGLVGPNGAGKTTTLSMIAGLLRPDQGSIRINGIDAAAHPRDAKRLIGVLPDRLRTFDRLTGRQLLYYCGVLRGLDPALVHTRTADLARAFDLGDALGRRVSDYSAGMTKKVMLAGAMIHSPRLLVLDEPFEAVDPVSAAVILDILGAYVRHGGTVILSSHGMEMIERVCTRVAVLVGGQVLAEGPVDQVRGELTLEQRLVQLTGGLSDVEGLEWLHTFSG